MAPGSAAREAVSGRDSRLIRDRAEGAGLTPGSANQSAGLIQQPSFRPKQAGVDCRGRSDLAWGPPPGRLECQAQSPRGGGPMSHHSSPRPRQRKWFDSAHASLCLLGGYLRLVGFFQPLEEGFPLRQKVRKYTPIQKVEMVFVSLLAGAKAIYHTGTT